MATVWLAADETLARPVAAKVLHDHLAADAVFRKRFRIEALSAARLSHPNIVSVFDTGIHEDRPFIVMEHLSGGTLKDLVNQSGTLDPERAALIGAEVCKALQYAHSSGIVHRDIKPANILFSESGLVKVGDFGIAKAAFFPNDLTDTGAVLGTVRYLAPEQVEGLEPDGRADIYSLAIVLYEAITGSAPFTGDNDLATATARVGKLARPPRDFVPSVSKGLDAAIMKAMDPNRDVRFADAASFGQALLQAAGQSDSTFGPTTQVRVPPKSKAEPSSFVSAEFRWLVPTLLIVLLAVGLVLGVPALRNRVGGVISKGAPKEPAAVRIVGGSSYDPPPGDGTENDGQVPLAFDGKPTTWWATVGYRTEQFGGLKKGVGIYFDLGAPSPLRRVTVESVTGGWSGTMRFSDDGRNWSPIGRSEQVAGKHTFETQGNHQYWMVWATSLVRTPGEGSSRNPYSVAIKEITPAG